MYYKEEELNRFWEVENNVCGCVMKEEKHSLETFDLSDRGNYYIGLCTNSQTLFCRIEKKEEGHRYLGNLNPCSLIFAKDGKEERYNTLFPKVAWGITAWLLFHYQYDSDLEELYNEDDSRDDIFARYKDLCYTIHKARYAKRYNHYSKNNPKKIDELDELFITTHIQQEREYISKFSHHECMTEEYYKAILQCANEYIQWVEDEKRNEVQEVKTTTPSIEDVYHESKALHYDRILDYLKAWNESDHNKRHISVIDADIATEEFRHRIRTADMNVITAVGYRDYLTLQLAPYFSKEWIREVEQNVGRAKENMSSNCSRLPKEFRNNFNIKKYEIK